MHIELNIPISAWIADDDFEKLKDYLEDTELFRKILNNTFFCWEEGRYSFSTEKIMESTEQLIANVIYQIVNIKMAEKYGKNVMIPSKSGNGQTNLSCQKAQEFLKSLDKSLPYANFNQDNPVKVTFKD